MGQVFNKGLDSCEKQERLLKRLKNIEEKTDRQLKENKDNMLGIKSISYTVKNEFSQEAKNILEKLDNQEKLINYRKFNFRGGNNVDYDFRNYRSLKELFKAIYFNDLRIGEAEGIQDEISDVIYALKNYRAKKLKYKETKEKLLINTQDFYDGREMIINAFKNEIFPAASTGFEEDVDEDELLKICCYENRLPTRYGEDQTRNDIKEGNKFGKVLTELDKNLHPNLIEKYFHKFS